MTSFLDRISSFLNRDLPGSIRQQTAKRKRLDLRQPLTETEYVAFDTELTGLDFRRDSIISIGAVKLAGGRILPAKTFYRLVKPESALKHQSVVVHEITHADLKNAAELSDVMIEFIRFIDDAVLIGHFVHIDLNFINRALKDLYGRTLRNPAVDTATLHEWLLANTSGLARHFHGQTVRSDLFSLAKKYGIAVDKSHNAFGDAYVTAQLFQRFICFLPQCGVHTVKELLTISRP